MKENERGFGIWITGLPASGKSTLAELVKQKLEEDGLNVQILDSDALRKVLTPEPKYTREERNWFYHSLVYIAKILTQQGVNVIIAATGHRRVYRDWARAAMDPFAEVYLNCLLSTCMRRDQKGIYKLALVKTDSSVPGVNEMYEVPLYPELVLNSERHEPEELADELYDWVQYHFIQEKQTQELVN